MKKILLFSFLSCFIAVNVFAHGCASGKHDEKSEIGFKNSNCERQAHLKVNGMVCDFCAQTIEKAFEKDDMVEEAYFNLDDSLIGITYPDGKNPSDNDFKNYIEDAGYELVEIQRGCLSNS